MNDSGIFLTFMHPAKYSCLYFVLSLISINNGEQQYYDSITLSLEGQDPKQFNCRLSQSQIPQSLHLTDYFDDFENVWKIVFDPDVDGELINGLPKISLQYNEQSQFMKSGFEDICYYLQNVDFNEEYDELPMPLLLQHSNDFYKLQQLTNQETTFMTNIEWFNENSNNDPFDLDMTRINNVFKIADYLQIKRLFTTIAARHASLMKNMNKQQMIKWLIDIKYSNPNEQKPIDRQCNNNHENARMVPLFTETHGLNAEECTIDANELNHYNFRVSDEILSFLSCADIRTFASISDMFYKRSNELKAIQSNIDSMIKILTNDDDATCLSLTDAEMVLYEPFLTIPQLKWSYNQRSIYNQLQTMTSAIDINVVGTFNFDTVSSLRGVFTIQSLQCTITSDDNSMRIVTRNNHLNGISLKFGKFAQQLNSFAQLKNILHIKIEIHSSRFLSSFNDVIGIHDINNIKEILIDHHSFSIIDFEEIFNINHHLENLQINSRQDKTKPTYVKNIQFLSEMKSLKQLGLANNNLGLFDFDALKGLINLEVLDLSNSNEFNYVIEEKCVDFTFLNSLQKLQKLNLPQNRIQCIDNFRSFQGSNLRHIDLSGNKFSRFSDGMADTSSARPSCLDFESFDNIHQLQWLDLSNNQIECIINLESIQQHTQLQMLDLNENHLSLSMIDFTKFDELKPKMNSLRHIDFTNMNLKYTSRSNNKNCFDLTFLKFMPNIDRLYLSNNKIECIENLSVLQREDIKLRHLVLDDNNLLSFDFADLIDSYIEKIDLSSNHLSFEALKNFDIDTLSRINPYVAVYILITHGNDEKLKQKMGTLRSPQVAIG